MERENLLTFILRQLRQLRRKPKATASCKREEKKKKAVEEEEEHD